MSEVGPGNSRASQDAAADAFRSQPVLFCECGGRARILGIAAWAVFTLVVALSFFDVAARSVLATLHVAALACALWSLISGIVALLRIKANSGLLWGRRSAIAGICFSGAYVATVIALALAILPAEARARVHARKLLCSYRLEYMADACGAWRERRGASLWYPRSLKALVDDDVLQSRWQLLCPSRDVRRVMPEGHFTDYEALFDRAGFEIRTWMVSGGLPLAWDKLGNHPDGFHVVVFGGDAEFVVDDEKGSRRRELLAEVDAWIEKNRPKE